MQHGILESVETMLRGSPHLQLRNVKCELREEVLILRGVVPSFHLKQLAQTLLKDLDIEIENQIEVV